MKAVIAAGGMGTRLSSVAKDIPKALVKVGDKPVIEHQIILLKKHGVEEIHLLLGYLGNKIKEYLGDGSKWGVTLHYHQEEVPLGRTGALASIAHELKEDFLFLSGDIMMNFDVKKFINWHQQKKDSIASLVVQPTDHPFDSDLVQINEEGKVISLMIKPHAPEAFFKNLAIASIFIFSPAVLDYIPKDKKSDFEKDVLPGLLQSGRPVYAYNTPEYLRDMGTPDRLGLAEIDYASKKIERLHANNKRKAIFIDRDGVINEWVDYLSSKEDFKVYPFAHEAIKKINNSEYLTIIITNQPALGMGLMTHENLGHIHNILETELGRSGIKLDGLYYCPHHPEKGAAPEFKIVCDCRKPSIGMIKRAVKDFNIDLSRSFFIGDSTTDAKTAENAGVAFVGVETGLGMKDGKYPLSKKYPVFENMLEAVNHIL